MFLICTPLLFLKIFFTVKKSDIDTLDKPTARQHIDVVPT